MDYTPWVKNLYQETNTLWYNHSEKSDSGYAIFYSPVNQESKDFLIIGYNPGENEVDFDMSKQLDAPAKHEYLQGNYRLAQIMRDKILPTDILPIKETIKLNLIFFRTKNDIEYIPKDFIKFSFEKTKEIIEVLKPKLIITEGLETYYQLISLLGGIDFPTSNSDTKVKRNIIRSGKMELFNHTVYLIGLFHPIGASVSNEECALIKKEISRTVERIKDFKEIIEIPKPNIAYCFVNNHTKEILNNIAQSYNVAVSEISNDSFSSAEYQFDVLISDINKIRTHENLISWLEQISEEWNKYPNKDDLPFYLKPPICISTAKPHSIESIRRLKYFEVNTNITTKDLISKIKSKFWIE